MHKTAIVLPTDLNKRFFSVFERYWLHFTKNYLGMLWIFKTRKI